MRKIAIVMTYFDRLFQVKKTIDSIMRSKYNNYHIIVVDDQSPEPLKIDNPLVTVIRAENKTWTNPEPAYNKGLKAALMLRSEIIIIQNAENYHENDILIYTDKHLTDDNYIVYPCYSIDKLNTFNPHDVDMIIEQSNKGASRDGENAWYHHPIFRPVYYDFCAAITAKNMKELNGYDERFSDGCGYGDNYLLSRIQNKGLKIESPLSPFVVHQWHYTSINIPDKAERVIRNRILFDQLHNDNNIRAKHIYTEDL